MLGLVFLGTDVFFDEVKIKIKAGNGGDGAVSFHREKYVAAGGPDGGDGGRGGNVIIKPDEKVDTLIDFRFKKKYVAESGATGAGNNRKGKSGEDLIIRVPVGTVIIDAETEAVIADTSNGEERIIALGGKGGFGNARFSTPTRQIPMYAKSGKPGEQLEVILELKMIADAGLIGFPNVGKSTLLSCISAARPKVANYHFTTLEPMLGVVEIGMDSRFVAADIPGLIEGASEGLGLGHSFLRHIERCRVLLHVVDVSGSEGRDPIEDYKQINKELGSYNETLLDKPQIVVGNKCDIATEEQIEALRSFCSENGIEFIPVSAATMQGIDDLKKAAYALIQKTPKPAPFEETYVKPEPKIGRTFEITEEDGKYFIEAPWLERILWNTDPDDYNSLQYFQNALQESGIVDRLREMGVHDEDTVVIGDYEFNYVS